MRLINILVVVFLMAAFAVGISVKDQEMSEINLLLDNVSVTASNFTLTNVSDNPYIEGGFNVFQHAVQFGIVTGVEVMRMGILFGHDNPEYFDSQFILNIARLLIWVTFLNLLFVPMLYLLAFLGVFIVWVIGKFNSPTPKRS